MQDFKFSQAAIDAVTTHFGDYTKHIELVNNHSMFLKSYLQGSFRSFIDFKTFMRCYEKNDFSEILNLIEVSNNKAITKDMVNAEIDAYLSKKRELEDAETTRN